MTRIFIWDKAMLEEAANQPDPLSAMVFVDWHYPDDILIETFKQYVKQQRPKERDKTIHRYFIATFGRWASCQLLPFIE